MGKMKCEIKNEIEEFKIEAKQEIKGELLEDLSLFINKRINFIETFMKKEDKNEIGSKIEPENFELIKNEKTIKDSKLHSKNFIEQVNTQKNNVVEEIDVEE